MEFDDLRTFVTVAETRSISQAARQMFLTQPAVTRRLQRFETVLGSSLIDRRRRPFVLTATGKDVLARCRGVLNSIRQIETSIAQDGAPSGELNIGVAHALTEIALKEPLDRVRRKFPRVNLRLKTGWSRPLLEQARSGLLDAALILLPEDQDMPSGLKAEAVANEQLVVIAARRKAPLARTVASLQGVNWILNPEGCGARAALEQALRRAGITFHVALETYNYDLQLNLVSRNRGLSLVPSRILTRSPLRSRLRVLRISGLNFPMTVWSVQGPPSGSLEPIVAALTRELKEEL